MTARFRNPHFIDIDLAQVPSAMEQRAESWRRKPKPSPSEKEKNHAL